MITNSFKELPQINSSLSIQLSLNGFSFFISSQQLNSDALAFRFDSRKSEKELLEVLSDFIIKHEVLQQNFRKVTITYSDYIFSVVPQEIFQEEQKENYLKYNVKPLASDQLFHTNVLQNEIVFSIPEVIKTKLEEYYDITQFNHLSSVLLNHISKEYKQSLSHRIFIYSYEDFFYVLVLNGQQLLFCNTFPYETTGDFLYYLLFAFEQLNLNSTKETLYLLNAINEDTLSFIEPYIYDIKIPASIPKNFVHLANLQS